MAEWKVLIKDHHPGYIDWEEYEKNQSAIAGNLRKHGQSSRWPGTAERVIAMQALRSQAGGKNNP